MKKVTILFMLCAFSYLANAQFQISGVPAPWALAFRYNETEITPPIADNVRAVGIGNFSILGGGATPQARLHVNSFFFPATNAATTFIQGELFRTDGPNNVLNTWRLFTGATAATSAEIGMIFNYANNPTVADQTNFSLQASVRDMSFYTLPITANTVGTERMRIVGVNRNLFLANAITTYPVTAGNVGIRTQSPSVLLQIGGNVTNAGGFRDWMSVGTYYQFGTDNMYTGYRSTTGDAIINWGNNPTIGGPDRLLFVFTAATNINPPTPFASGINGLEGIRLVSNGNQIFTGFGGDPNNPNQNAYTANPDPGNTIEINSPAIVVGPTNSGLRFTDLNSTAIPIPNPGTGVLSVNLLGDVVYVPGATGTVNAANNGCSLSNPSTVVLGNNVGGTLAALSSDREIPMNSKNIIFTGPPDTYPGKVGFGISAGNIGFLALRTTPITMQVNGSISLFDGSGNSSLFFGEEQFAAGSGIVGEWGIQYFGGGLNFWKPFQSHGYGFGNFFLFLSDNGNVRIGGTANISTTAPVNRLDINSNVPATTLNPSNATSPTRSGLRFTNLNNTMNPDAVTNPSANVLSVNSTGDVILVPGGGGALALSCGNPASILPAGPGNNARIGLNGNNFYFDGQGSTTNTNSVGIGMSCGNFLGAKLDVLSGDQSYGGQFIVNGLTANTSFNQVGVIALVTNASTYYRYGVVGMSHTSEPGVNIGIGASSNANATYNEGISAYGMGGTNNYGIIASGGSPAGAFAFGTFAGIFNGEVCINSPTWLQFIVQPSDSILKNNISSYKQGLNIIRQINTVSYKYNGKGGYDSTKNQIGVIAEDINRIPILSEYAIDSLNIALDLQNPSPTNILGIKNDAIFYTAVNAIKELDSSVTKLSSPPSAPELVSPQNGETLGDSLHPNIILTWKASIGAVLYYVEGSRDTSFSQNQKIYESTQYDTVFNAVNAGDTCTVYWHVLAINGNGRSPFSETRYYLNIPSEKVPIQPRDSAISHEATLSDSTLKTDVSTLSNAIELITQMQAVKFYWDTINNTWLSATEQIGLIGQQVNNIVPQVVFKDSAGYYNIQYGRLVALLVEGMKEQQLQIDSLKTIVMGTNNKSTGDNGNNESQSNMQYVELITENAIILNQNDPNPFAEETDITYYLPDDVSNAKIMFYDNTGKIIKTVELIGKGNGTLHVYASNLSAGIYAYALVADGKIIDTKKMVCTKK